MCGIVGIIQRGQIQTELLVRMAEAIRHRGPDDYGYVVIDSETGASSFFRDEEPHNGRHNIGMAHRRLSIIDLSPNGRQPMTIENGTYWITYNGEIYNYLEIREQLAAKGRKFSTRTDTEVILHAYAEWGEDCLERFNGMFAFAIWDGKKKELFAARDRFGEKPFYYFIDHERFLFASEIKALLKCPRIRVEANERAIFDFLTWGIHDHFEQTFFRAISQLLPSHYLRVSRNLDIQVHRYWTLETRTYAANNYYHDFREQFERSVRIRLRSDVKVGSCLSGGLDSSAIVCMMNDIRASSVVEAVGQKIETVSSCFDDKAFDEREYIDEVIHSTSSSRNYAFPSPEEFWQTLDQLIQQQDEPFGSASIYAQWCVLRKAKEIGIKVLLDGQGGDEILAGYRKFLYFYIYSLLKSGKVITAVNEIIGALKRGDEGLLDFTAAKRYLPDIISPLIPHIQDLFLPEFNSLRTQSTVRLGAQGELADRQIRDLTMTSIPPLLRYEDRNSMAFAVETRLPFLDHELVQCVVNYPQEYKIRHGRTKYVMREALADIIPEKIRTRRTKLGFVTPQKKWLQGPLKDEISCLVAERRLRCEKYIDIEKLRTQWNMFCQGGKSISDRELFRIVVLEKWMRLNNQ